MGIISQLCHITFNDSKDDKKVEQLSDKFAYLIPELEFSPAEVLSLLLEHRTSPKNTITGVEAWIARVREEKRNKLKRESSWVHGE
jgi:chaperone BCS1